MEHFFLKIPSGQLVAAHHIVLLGFQETGVEDQRRCEVQASLTDGDTHVLATFQGPGCRAAAEQFLSDALDQLGARQLQLRPATPA